MTRLSTFEPLFRKSIGFDRFSDLFESLIQGDHGNGYPPYNIEKLSDDKYRIVMALAGFRNDDIEITAKNDTLSIVGRVKQDDDTVTYLHKGIATRAFDRTFRLADYVHVKQAQLNDGLLVIDLEREVPEEAKPRSIPIQAGDSSH